MEEKVFRLPAVAAELEQWVEARLHTDGLNNIEAIKALQQQLTGSVANPYYVIIDPKSEQKLRVLEGATTPDRFIAFLRGQGEQ